MLPWLIVKREKAQMTVETYLGEVEGIQDVVYGGS